MFLGDIASPSLSDPEVIELARSVGRVIVTADSDFSTLIALSGESGPSIILFRGTTNRRAARQSVLFLARFAEIEAPLTDGAVLVFEETRVRIRSLPVKGEE